MTDEEAAKALSDLAAHFGEPVMPMSKYCNALTTWQRAVMDGARDAGENDPHDLKRISDAASLTFLSITKSNLLARLLYEGEELRTEKCPVHKGRWSGCHWGRIECVSEQYPEGCYNGSNVTGWLPTAKQLEAQMAWHKERDFPLLKEPPRKTIWTAEDFETFQNPLFCEHGWNSVIFKCDETAPKGHCLRIDSNATE